MFQASVSDYSIIRLCRLFLTTLIYPPHLPQPFYVSSYSSSPYRPPFSSLQRRFTALSRPLPTSSLGMDRCPPGLCPHPPPEGLLRSSLRPTPHDCVLRCTFSLPCRPRPVTRSLLVTGGRPPLVIHFPVCTRLSPFPV